MFGAVADNIMAQHIPITGSIELTYRCNVACKFCYQSGERDDELSLQEMTALLDDLAALKCLFLSFTGGEPLLHDDFWDIAEYAASKNFALTLQTNGTLLTEQNVRQLKELNFFDVHVSVLGGRAETHDRLMQSPGAFDKIMQAARMLREYGLRVFFKTTIVKDNINEMQEIDALAKKIECEQMMAPIVAPKNNGDRSPCSFRLSDGEMKAFYEYAFRKIPAGMEEYESHAGLAMINCSSGRTCFCINPHGDVYPCIGLPRSVGNIRDRSFADIWNDNEFLTMMRDMELKDLPSCASCELLEVCMRCKGLAYNEDGNLFNRSTEACRIARIVKEVTDHEKTAV
ncbi:radical SAM/SPASM domain-containing protein [Candidatus Omnitrophota bacterium]